MAFKFIVANALVDFMIKITSLHNCKLKTPAKLSCKVRLFFCDQELHSEYSIFRKASNLLFICLNVKQNSA